TRDYGELRSRRHERHRRPLARPRPSRTVRRKRRCPAVAPARPPPPQKHPRNLLTCTFHPRTLPRRPLLGAGTTANHRRTTNGKIASTLRYCLITQSYFPKGPGISFAVPQHYDTEDIEGEPRMRKAMAVTGAFA